MREGVVLVEVQDLTLGIGGRQLLSGVNLHMERGDVFGLLGPNGAGKSLTMSVLTGLRKPASGKVSVLGLDPARQAEQLHRETGILPEQNGFYDWMAAEEYLRWFAQLYGLSPSSAQVARHFAQVGLNVANRMPIATWSRGMRQRLGLARALINNPKLLILDEPTNGLDPRGRKDIHDVLLDLARNQGVGVLLCTHLLDDVDRLCTRVGIIHHGRTVLEGRLSELLAYRSGASHYRLRLASADSRTSMPSDVTLVAQEDQWIHVALSGERPPSAVWEGMLAKGWGILEIHAEGGSLEDLYLSVTRERAAA
jgi:ABC-2 type transport system ATP-binding protein